MTILSTLTTQSHIGVQVSGFSPSIPIARYTAAEINQLLEGTSPVPEGIRFHYEKNNGVTRGLVAVSLGIMNIGSDQKNRELILDFTAQKALRRGAETGDMNLQEYQRLFPQGSQQKNAGSTCVFFSRLDLEAILAQTGFTVTGIDFFPTTYDFRISNLVEIYDTLVAVGVNDQGTTQGIQIRSEMPCPPNCGDDYP